MSNSIFHVRPLDSGKGWAIDEYDGRGAWQHAWDGCQARKHLLDRCRRAAGCAA